MPDDQRTIPITKGRPHLVTKTPTSPPLVDRRVRERRKPMPPVPLEKIVWPFVAGICLAVLAPEVLYVAGRLGHWVASLVFPFTLLAARPEFGYGASAAKMLSAIALYLQFPLEGLLTMLNLRRHIPLRQTVSRLALLHLAGAALVWLLERPHVR